MFAWSVTVRQRYSKFRASSECENIRAHIPKAGKQISCSLHPLRYCQLSQLKRHLWYEPHRQCPFSKCDGSHCLSSTSSILESLAPSGLFFHCFCLNSLTTALSKHLTNPFLVASTLALHQNREMLDPDKFCSLCHSTFNNPVMAQQHYMGKKHRKQETKLRLMAHYGRLADPAVSDLPGERARLVHRTGPGTEHWSSLDDPRVCCFLPLLNHGLQTQKAVRKPGLVYIPTLRRTNQGPSGYIVGTCL